MEAARPKVTPLTRPTRTRSHVPPLGVRPTPDGGIDVAVLASHAHGVELCLVDVVDPDKDQHDPERYTERRITLDGPTYGVWHGHVANVSPGQRYGFRVHGPWDPGAGMRHNPAKLLLDPYARGIEGEVAYVPATLDGGAGDDGGPDEQDSLPYVPHAVVMPAEQGPRSSQRPRVPWADTVVYEAHVRGLTLLHPEVPEELRGTYAGLAHPAVIEHLTSLGVTTLELLPIHASTAEPWLAGRGLTNYWGYSTMGFFAPHPAYATAAAREAGPAAVLDEVRGMVHLLHEAGIEVILDVVYNHTCEGGDDALHLSWRGLDNTLYYLHDGGTPARLADVTGTGNTLDFRRTRVVQMALDSLRYWAEVVGVDGYRFDLAVTLGRDHDGYNPDHPFLSALRTDPVLSGLKLVAEPWDVGPGGWRTGRFPAPMAEWNDRFRNAARSFWLEAARAGSHGAPMHGLRELTTRLAGSADLFGHSDPPLMRGPVASVNYVTAHDGFTLADLVAFDHKHNEANGEDNRDGTDDNRSWNHGVEGHTPEGDDATTEPWSAVVPLRRRSQRNLLATLLLAAGTPMITAGDEMGRSQGGNNNAYAQDTAISWVDWDLNAADRELLATARYLVGLRSEHAALRAESFFLGTPRPGEDHPDLLWFGTDGVLMDAEAWAVDGRRLIQMLRPGPGDDEADVLCVLHGGLEDVVLTLPEPLEGAGPWQRVWSSTWDTPDGPEQADEEETPGTALVESLSVEVFVARR
ncbi:glycogen debranching protein GlgX [Isoptericola sp. b408]|uniref:glycogen debranching protein GlgX n=1 Tax=Isoptericola sp. b408 TaxID=3064653 RepID=UPI00271373B1|nr:glycogen debranching protein GlgX [Isoptericola sp. b408]MDO8150825.1 glycogen debranching protein GlgX [Isoptericola sp. b408]